MFWPYDAGYSGMYWPFRIIFYEESEMTRGTFAPPRKSNSSYDDDDYEYDDYEYDDDEDEDDEDDDDDDEDEA